MEDLTELILLQMNSINKDVEGFVAGLLSDDLTKEQLTSFGHRLVDLAELILQRAEGTSTMVIEGSYQHRARRRAALSVVSPRWERGGLRTCTDLTAISNTPAERSTPELWNPACRRLRVKRLAMPIESEPETETQPKQRSGTGRKNRNRVAELPAGNGSS